MNYKKEVGVLKFGRGFPRNQNRALIAALMLCSAMLGSLLAVHAYQEPKQEAARSVGATPEILIPEQTLELKDADGNDIAIMDAGGGGCTVIGVGGSRAFAVLAYENNHVVVHIPQSYQTILADEDARKKSSPQNGGEKLEERLRRMSAAEKAQETSKLPQQRHSWSDLRRLEFLINPEEWAPLQITTTWRDHGSRHTWLDFSGSKPEELTQPRTAANHDTKSRIRSVAQLVPTKDLRLVDRNGWRFATLGATASGDPAIAFTDRNGGVRAVWAQRHGIISTAPGWWEIALYDSDKLRVSVELRPGRPPNIVVFDNLMTPYGLSLDGNKPSIKEDGRTEFPELWSLDFAPRGPVALFDNRGKQLWKAP